MSRKKDYTETRRENRVVGFMRDRQKRLPVRPQRARSEAYAAIRRTLSDARTQLEAIFTIPLAEGHHAVKRNLRPLLFIVRDDDVIHDMSVDEIFHRPAEVRGIDAVHGRALADGRGQEKHLLVRLFLLQTIDQIEFRPDRPCRPGGRRGDGANDEFRRPDQVRLVDHIFVAFRMDDHLPFRILLAEIVDVRRLKHLVHAAMALPQNQLAPAGSPPRNCRRAA